MCLTLFFPTFLHILMGRHRAILKDDGRSWRQKGFKIAILGELQDIIRRVGSGGVQSLSCIQLFAALWTEARQAPLSSTVSQLLLRLLSLQSCLTLCDLIDGSPPGSPVPGILQARAPEWVATSFSNA